MGLTYIPQQRSPWEQMLPGFLQSFVFNQMANKRQDKRIEAANELSTSKLEETRKYAEGQQAEERKYTESVAEQKEKDKPIWMHHPKLKRKQQVKPTEAEGLKKAGWVMGQPYGSQSQTSLTVGPDGNIQFVQGAGLPPVMGELTTASKTASQKNVKSLSERKARLEESMAKWKPHYNTFLTKGTMWLRGLQEKAQGLPGVSEVAPQAKKELAEYTDFQTSSLEDFSKTIHDLSGSALTPLEAKIHRAWIQDAKKDSSTQWMTKLKQNWMSVNKSLAREHYYLNILKTPKADYDKLRKGNIISEASFDKVVDRKYAEHVTRLRKEKPNAPWEQIKAEAMGMVKTSFFGF